MEQITRMLTAVTAARMLAEKITNETPATNPVYRAAVGAMGYLEAVEYQLETEKIRIEKGERHAG